MEINEWWQDPATGEWLRVPNRQIGRVVSATFQNPFLRFEVDTGSPQKEVSPWKWDVASQQYRRPTSAGAFVNIISANRRHPVLEPTTDPTPAPIVPTETEVGYRVLGDGGAGDGIELEAASTGRIAVGATGDQTARFSLITSSSNITPSVTADELWKLKVAASAGGNGWVRATVTVGDTEIRWFISFYVVPSGVWANGAFMPARGTSYHPAPTLDAGSTSIRSRKVRSWAQSPNAVTQVQTLYPVLRLGSDAAPRYSEVTSLTPGVLTYMQPPPPGIGRVRVVGEVGDQGVIRATRVHRASSSANYGAPQTIWIGINIVAPAG